MFLDEIGDLAPSIQLKLLRFLETRQYYRVVESSPENSDVRIVAATNKELDKRSKAAVFAKIFTSGSQRARSSWRRCANGANIILLIANFIYQACNQFRSRSRSSRVRQGRCSSTIHGQVHPRTQESSRAPMVSDGDYITSAICR